MFYLGLIEAFFLYGSFSFLITLFVIKIPFQLLWEVLLNFGSFKNMFINYMLFSTPLFIILFIINRIIIWIDEKTFDFMGKEPWSFTDSLERAYVIITNPFRGLFVFFWAGEVVDSIFGWIEVSIHFIYSVFQILLLVFGFISLFK